MKTVHEAPRGSLEIVNDVDKVAGHSGKVVTGALLRVSTRGVEGVYREGGRIIKGCSAAEPYQNCESP